MTHPVWGERWSAPCLGALTVRRTG
eukprot:COSAG06_NODE_16925_length_972_cov_2.651775_1_plen_24_part_10